MEAEGGRGDPQHRATSDHNHICLQSKNTRLFFKGYSRVSVS